MANIKASLIISMTITLILIGVLLPIGLEDLTAYNGTYTYTNGTTMGTNATIGTLVGTIIPIMAIIGIVLSFVTYKNNN